MQCVEHVAARRIATLRVQKPENAPFLPSENRFFDPSGSVFLYRQMPFCHSRVGLKRMSAEGRCAVTKL